MTVSVGRPALAPLAWTLFAQAPPPARDDLIALVNRMVNHAIDPRRGVPPPTDTVTAWRIGPKAGWCHDYAVTKRWLLLALGFNAAELLLCECLAPDGEHHMVLRVGEIVLDNLTEAIGPMRYTVVRQQSAINQGLWETE